MIELRHNELVFSFPEVHPDARVGIDFQRTLRIPDDGKTYGLPPGLGRFPIQHVDDHADNVPLDWLRRGGVMMPMYQSEALWLHFNAHWCDSNDALYPCAIKVATGKIDAITGEAWRDGIAEKPQNYLVVPEQPWLDGYCVEKGTIRQFVAMPLGAGYTAEEQLTGKAEFGGLQIAVYPMKREVFERRFQKRPPRAFARSMRSEMRCEESVSYFSMGLAPGGRMRQEIYDDPFLITDWDTSQSSRCFVHLANSLVWRAITGKNPPHPAPTAKEYTAAGFPWFEYYSDANVLDAGKILKRLKSVAELGQEKGGVPLPENESVSPENIVHLRRALQPGQVREGAF